MIKVRCIMGKEVCNEHSLHNPSPAKQKVTGILPSTSTSSQAVF